MFKTFSFPALALTAILSLAAPMGASAHTVPGHSSAVQHIQCQSGLFGCFWKYRGPVNQEAARAYLEDSQAVARAIIDRFDTVQSVQYSPSRRLAVIEATPGKRVDNFQQNDIINMILESHLVLDEIRFMANNHTRIHAGRRVIRDLGGASRFYALRNVQFEANIATPTEALRRDLRAHQPGQPITHAFGDIFISMR